MLTITDGGSLARALGSSIDPRLKRLVALRREQLGGNIAEHARFVIVQPGDTIDALEAELGFRIVGDPDLALPPEWVADHGGVFEAVWVLTDCGFAHVVLAPEADGVDPELIALCRACAAEHA